jgi:ribosome biogenesis protein SSF1/2
VNIYFNGDDGVHSRFLLLAMARKRKNRTHLKGSVPAGAIPDGVPKSFVVKHGQVGLSIAQLVRDFRKVMEPNTASRLKV